MAILGQDIQVKSLQLNEMSWYPHVNDFGSWPHTFQKFDVPLTLACAEKTPAGIEASGYSRDSGGVNTETRRVSADMDR